MSLELSGTTPAIKGVAGSVSAPAITGDDTNTGISFPAADTIKFSAGGVEKFAISASGLSGDGSGLSGISGGKFASYAIIGDQKSNNTHGGTFTSGAWQTRDLNAELSDPDGIVSISSNQFTLAAGSYLVKASAPARRCAYHQTRLQNITDSTTVEYGSSEQSYGTGNDNYYVTRSFLSAQFTISASKVFEIQHRCGTTHTSYGMGVASNFGNTELYTLVEIYKES